jgi:hypothetical protein
MNSSPRHGERPIRFELGLPVQFRPVGASQWIEGTSRDISRSGLLFRSDSEIPLGTELEVIIAMPKELTGSRAVQVVCTGTVVRQLASAAPADPNFLALEITDYNFVRLD